MISSPPISSGEIYPAFRELGKNVLEQVAHRRIIPQHAKP
jgi:hypothetical protein